MHDDTEEILHPNRGARPIAVVSNRGPSSTRQLEGGGQQAIKFGAPAAERRSDCSGRIDARELGSPACPLQRRRQPFRRARDERCVGNVRPALTQGPTGPPHARLQRSGGGRPAEDGQARSSRVRDQRRGCARSRLSRTADSVKHEGVERSFFGRSQIVELFIPFQTHHTLDVCSTDPLDVASVERRRETNLTVGPTSSACASLHVDSH